jgi:hypothetical protein
VEHLSLSAYSASALRAQFDFDFTAIWFKFDVGARDGGVDVAVIFCQIYGPLRLATNFRSKCA